MQIFLQGEIVTVLYGGVSFDAVYVGLAKTDKGIGVSPTYHLVKDQAGREWEVTDYQIGPKL